MAPAWVLLDRFVDVCFEDGNDEAAAAAEKQKGVALQSVIDHLGSMKPDVLLLPAPPRIATFRLVGSTKAHEVLGGLASSSFVACADKSIVVLYGGRYSGPGSSARGCYLVFDSAAAGGTSRQLATVPRLPLAEDLTGIGNGPVVLRRHPPRADAAASYLLAELAATPHLDLPDAELYLWWSDAPTAQWAKKVVRLPREVSFEPGKHIFYADASFSFGPSNLCWVDLLHGIVLCQDPGQQDSQFSFIPLPEGCPSVDVSTDHPFRPRVHEFRSVRYIDGLIKLVAIEGILEGWEGNQFSLAIWTLSPDLTEWKKGEVFRLEDLWAKDEYLMLNLPRYTPVCPVLGESDVVYIIVNDVKLRDIFRGSELLKTEVEVNGQYILELNMRCNDIISVICGHPASLVQLMPSLLATDFTAYLQGSNGVQK